MYIILINILCNLLILSNYIVHGIPPVLRDDEFDSPYDVFTMSVNVLTCPPEIWNHSYSTSFKEVLSYYINVFCGTRTNDDYYRCDPLLYTNDSLVTTPEDVIFLGGYPKRTFVYWEIQFVVLWHPCYSRPCPAIKPFANKNILANVLFLFSSHISDDLDFIIIDFDRDEPFDSTSRIVNIMILPCGLAVSLIMAGIVWLAIAVDKRRQRIEEEIRMIAMQKKRDSKKNLFGKSDKTLQWEYPDFDEKIYIIQPGQANPMLLDVTRIKVPDRLPANGKFGKVGIEDTTTAHGDLPNHVPDPNCTISMILPKTVKRQHTLKTDEEHASPSKNKWHFIKIYNSSRHNQGQQKRLHEQRHQQQQQQQKKTNAWRGGNILLRPLGKRAADGPAEPTQQFL